MAYNIDPLSGDIIIAGFDQGIGASPQSGLTDMRSVNPASIPGEVSVAFSLNPQYQCPTLSGITATTSTSNAITLTTTTPLEVGQAIYITSAGTSGLSTTQVYWISRVVSYTGTTEIITLTTTYGQTGTALALSNGTITFSVYTLTLGLRGQITKNYMVESQDGFHWILDSNGFVWTDKVLTSGGTGVTSTQSWTYTGNIGAVGANSDPAAFGNGMVYFQPVHPTNNFFDGYIFIFRQQQIDYLKVVNAGSSIAAASLSWKYDWSQYWVGGSTELKLALLWGEVVGYPHEAIPDPSGRIIFCDAYVLGCFYQNSINTAFDPTNNTTFTVIDSAPSASVPPTDILMSIAYNPNQTYIGGGLRNVAYVYEAFTSASSSSPLLQSLVLLPENMTRNALTVGNNTYLFSGNRGRIYVTNGSQADLFAKVPDHLSNTVQPVFEWGAVTYVNNKLCFGIYQSVSDTLTTANNYGGIWMLDLETQALYVSNELSSGYQDYCCALLQMNNEEYSGNGVIAGWNSPNTFAWGQSGIGSSTNNPYTDGMSWVTSDMIAVGSFLKRTSPNQVEYKLSRPMVAGESLTIKIGYYLDMTYASFITAGTFSYSLDPSVNNISGNTVSFPVQGVNNIMGQQWLLVQCILTSTGSNPSYLRLTHLRVAGATNKDNIPTQPFSLA